MTPAQALAWLRGLGPAAGAVAYLPGWRRDPAGTWCCAFWRWHTSYRSMQNRSDVEETLPRVPPVPAALVLHDLVAEGGWDWWYAGEPDLKLVSNVGFADADGAAESALCYAHTLASHQKPGW